MRFKVRLSRARGHVPAPVRAVALAAALVGAFGCSSSTTGGRSLPRHALVNRARAGEEPPTTARASAVVSFAAAQIGKRYCWGGTGPTCFDCSGLAQSAWAWAGVHVPRTSRLIVETLPEIGLDDVRAGDILWWPGHVGIYAGNGWMIDALDARHGVVVRLASDPLRAFRPVEWLESGSYAGATGGDSMATGGHAPSVR